MLFFFRKLLCVQPILMVLSLVENIGAQPDCKEPADSSFRTVTMATTSLGEVPNSGWNGPVQIAVDPDGKVYVAMMRTGEIRMITPGSTAATLIGTIPTYFNTEDGLLGIVLAPNFTASHWIYAFYSDPATSGANRGCELARFTITNNQLTQKKVILRFPRDPNDRFHAGGGLAMDGTGLLVVGTGDNTNPHDAINAGYGPVNEGSSTGDAQRTSSNSMDLRGKVLRIRPILFPDNQTPTPGIGGTYTIPAGNLHEVITTLPNWNNQNVDLVRKEIYSMGHRNPYHVRIDTRTQWIFFGDVGPDAESSSPTRGPQGHDEWNLVKAPGFFGHPYCNGMNMAYGAYPGYETKYNCAMPVNNSPNNTGIKNLPPATLPLAAYANSDNDARFGSPGGEAAIGSPMYRYDPKLVSTVKFPPFYEGKVVFFDWTRRIFRLMTLGPTGTLASTASAVKPFAPKGLTTAFSYIDAQFGPAGELYVLKFSDDNASLGAGPALYRIEFTGAYDDSCYVPFGPDNIGTQIKKNVKPFASLHGKGFYQLPVGYRSLELFDLSGRKVWTYRRENAVHALEVPLPSNLSRGIFQARLLP